MKMKICLREARTVDMPLVKKTFVETSWQYAPETQKKLLDREKWNARVTKYYENVLKGENIQVFIAENEQNEYVGHLIVGQTKSVFTELTSGYVFDVFVKEKFRRKGIGKTLLKEAEDYLREKGYSRIALSVLARNDSAISLYTKIGYKPERITMTKEIT